MTVFDSRRTIFVIIRHKCYDDVSQSHYMCLNGGFKFKHFSPICRVQNKKFVTKDTT